MGNGIPQETQLCLEAAPGPIPLRKMSRGLLSHAHQIYILKNFPNGSASKESAFKKKNLPAIQEMQEMGVRSLGRKDPLE